MSAQKSRIAVLAIVIKRKKQRSLESVKKGKCWAREWISKRNENGVHANLLKEVENEEEIAQTLKCAKSKKMEEVTRYYFSSLKSLPT